MNLGKLIRWHRNRAESCTLREQYHLLRGEREPARKARQRARFHMECADLLQGIADGQQ